MLLRLATILSEEEDEPTDTSSDLISETSGSEVVDLLERSMHEQAQQRDNMTGVAGGLKNGIPGWKRGLDLAVIAVFSPMLVVVGVAVAVVIKVGSRGPVLFRQRRVGYKGQQFTCLKFRTMHVNAETKSHQGYTAQLIKSEAPMTKLDASNDPRVIPFGSILRATGLDELPQMLNVLCGEMSLVGPRPCIPYEFEMYEPWQRRRFDAAPGLTGLWQVSGKNRTTFTQMRRNFHARSAPSHSWRPRRDRQSEAVRRSIAGPAIDS